MVAACFFFVSDGREVSVLGIVPGAGADAVLSRTSLPLGVFIINSLLSLSSGGASCQGWPGWCSKKNIGYSVFNRKSPEESELVKLFPFFYGGGSHTLQCDRSREHVCHEWLSV